MTEIILIEDASLRVEVAPHLGGAMLRFDAVGPGATPEPIFRPTPEQDRAAVPFEPNTAACYPLVPWVSRLCPAQLPTATGPLAIPPNRPREAYPIHGWGAYVPWRVLSRTATAVILALEHDGPPPFSARLTYEIRPGATLGMMLAVTNGLDRPVGLGLGFHPWLPRHANGRLFAPARHVWMSGPDKIPFAAEAPPEDWDFSTEKTLPARDVDHGFGGWSGQAHYGWTTGETRWRLTVESDCDEYILYAPADRPFFCFEPTSHKPSPGQTGALDGLVMVEPGAVLRRSASFTVARAAADRPV